LIVHGAATMELIICGLFEYYIRVSNIPLLVPLAALLYFAMLFIIRGMEGHFPLLLSVFARQEGDTNVKKNDVR
jgi:hypothetical protein